jgi:hypothetical protein
MHNQTKGGPTLWSKSSNAHRQRYNADTHSSHFIAVQVLFRLMQWARSILHVQRQRGTRRADSIEAARIILVNAVDRMPEVAAFHYNLACYECQLGNLDESKTRLKQAFQLESRYRIKALIAARPVFVVDMAGRKFAM